MRCVRLINNFVFRNSLKMSTFTQVFNPVTGKLEWQIQLEEYDYEQEVARSAYADMLHDWERNKKYHKALKSAIDDLRKANKPVKVLDIGTGSGLLAMMAAKYGADSVYACEAFKPVAECAAKVITDNNLSDKIKLIHKRSTELTVGPEGDLPERANLLVTEVFDTELIGEGALGTFKHAHENLLVPDCVVIPSSAVLYAQVVESSSVLAWHFVSDLTIPNISTILSPECVKNCAGSAAVHDLQLSQLDEDEFLPLTSPTLMKTFDFTSAQELNFHDSALVNVTAVASGKAELVFMWWEIEMYRGGNILSCAPKWAHPNGAQKLPWRDHWMQSVYYIPQAVNVTAGGNYQLGVHHDEYSFWFTFHDDLPFINAPAPMCTCGLHAHNSRCRIGMINDHARYGSYVSALTDIDNREDKVVFVCGESIPLVPIACKMGFKKVILCETEAHKIDTLFSFLNTNQMGDKVALIRKAPEELSREDLNGSKIDVVLSEPFFSTSVLQWDSIHFWYICESLKQHLHDDVVLIPRKLAVYGIAVQFEDLWKIRAPVKSTEGFNLKSFDSIIQRAIEECDNSVEPQPLWEYPSKPLSEKFHLCTVNFHQPLLKSSFSSEGTINFVADGICNGIAIWVDYFLDEKRIVSLGPVQTLNHSEKIRWYRYSSQGVKLFPFPENVSVNELHFKAQFSGQDGVMLFDFNVKPKI